MVEVRELRKHYGAFEALRGVGFSIARGEVVGFLGPNGAGKTTTMKILTGYLRASSGVARIAGLDVDADGLEVRRRVGYLPESAPLYSDMLVREYLDFIADARRLDRPSRGRRIGATAERCGISAVLNVPIAQLSKGYRQRVGLAQALLHEPDLLILDEPTSGLDPNQIVEIRALLKEIGREKTVILSTHILREVEVTCSRVLIINGGEIVADGGPRDLKRGDMIVVEGRGGAPPEMQAAFAAIDHVKEATLSGEPGPDRLVRVRLVTDGGSGVGAQVFAVARDRGWVLSEIRTEASTLEDVFQRLTISS